ncbi:FecCD family ABC transporter permease [Desulfurobacterium thermolithotrophum]|uniref:FecCD family ABC transporter permease n=1 Tax=Desulfurobacterium thermolithotrophum TaxID=64160 RepID=UPI0013D0D532|nr:iron ABC transporter permease [Desulfurobacterium thermolithotrophum]
MQKIILLLIVISSFAFSLFWNLSAFDKTILIDIRLPELLLAFSVGGLLGMGGGIFQGVFRNPLADPYILGVSAGGALGATISAWQGINIEFGALLGGLLTVFLISIVSFFLMDNLKILLFGVGINAFLSAFILFLFAVIPFYSVQDAFFFTLGYIPSIEIETALRYLLLSLLALLVFLPVAFRLDALSLGDELSFFSGISPNKEKFFYIIVISCFVSLFVAKAGIIGFVGIVVPHAVRFLGFRLYKEVLPLSFILGGSILVFSQGLAKNIFPPVVLPVGVITSIIGVPAFLYIVWRYSVVRS